MYENYGWKYVVTAIIAALWGLALGLNRIDLGLDLAGGSEIIYTLDFGGSPPSQQEADDAVRVLRERIDKLGIKELSIRRQGTRDVVVQIPDASETEVERLRAQIEKAGKLEFMLLVTGLGQAEVEANIRRVMELKARGQFKPNERYDVAYWTTDARGGEDVGAPALLERSTPAGKPMYVDGDKLENASRTLDDKGRPCVGFEWNAEGRKLFYELTSQNVGRRLAVVLDGQIRSAPEIRAAIGKRGVIDGGDKGWNDAELTSLVITLKAGALPAKPVFAYHKHVGPQLGRAALVVGGTAVVGSLLVVMLFMFWYYGTKAGLVANLALGLNLFLLLGTLAMFDATLTLPGIAGVLLTAGMAIDANILIYERIREEVDRGGSLKVAVQAGYDRAFWTIFDANITTTLTALVLTSVGTGPIRGFGITMAIGIAVSMFTSLFVTKAIYGAAVAKGFLTEIAFKQLFQRPNLDFWGAWPKALVCSISLICVGWLVFLARGDAKYGIDFTGGTQLQMLLKEPMEKLEVEREVKAHFAKLGIDPNAEIQRVGDLEAGGVERSREWNIRTRIVGSKSLAAKTSRGPLDALLTPAYGQDTAAVESPTPAADAPPPAAAPPAGEAAAAPEGAPGGAVDTTDEDFFEDEVKKLFAARLVEPYPAVDGQAIRWKEVGPEQVQATFRVDLIALGEGIQGTKRPITEARLREELPRAVRARLAKVQEELEAMGADRSKDDPAAAVRRAQLERRARVLEALAGPPGGAPTFELALVPGAAPSEIVPVDFTTPPLARADAEAAVDALKNALEQARNHEVYLGPTMPFPNVDLIGSSVAKNLKSKALFATFFSVVFICLYVWMRFDFFSGVSAIVALFHDILALLGFLAILDTVVTALGIPYDVKFSLTTITAFLTLVGYSINDTIVILDRIREEKNAAKAKEYTPEIVNGAINRTLSRTVLTSLTTLLTVVVLFVGTFFGLTAIQGFAVALLFGLIVGTYSSVFVAAPLLLADRKKVMLGIGGVALFVLATGIGSVVLG